MARNVRTARGDIVDFDALIIKQQMAEAPMNIEVQRRKAFIDSKEGKVRGQRSVANPGAVPAESTQLIEDQAKEEQPQALGSEFETAPEPKTTKKGK